MVCSQPTETATRSKGATCKAVADSTSCSRFANLLEALHGQTGQRVAVLVDEYDKPIPDALVEAPDVARANRDYLRGLSG